MPEEAKEVVRQPVVVRARSRPGVEERMAVRFPRVVARVFAIAARAVRRLPQRSRLRQALTRRTVQVGFEAVNRGNFVVFSLYHRDAELITAPGLVRLGFDPVYRGRDERIRFQRRWLDDWGEFQFMLEELIDLGDDRVLVVGRIEGTGLSSGAAFDDEWAVLFTISAGQVAREQFFFDHAEAFSAAGLARGTL